MSVVEVVAEGRLLMLVHQIRVGGVCFYGHCQQAVHYDICISGSKCKDAGKTGSIDYKKKLKKTQL